MLEGLEGVSSLCVNGAGFMRYIEEVSTSSLTKGMPLSARVAKSGCIRRLTQRSVATRHRTKKRLVGG